MEDDKVREFREAIEGLILRYHADASDGELQMPMLEDWFLIATLNDVGDSESNGKWLYMRGERQSTHRSIGLLVMASDFLRGIEPDD